MKKRHPTRAWNPAIVMPVWKYNPPIGKESISSLERASSGNFSRELSLTNENAKNTCYGHMCEKQCFIPIKEPLSITNTGFKKNYITHLLKFNHSLHARTSNCVI